MTNGGIRFVQALTAAALLALVGAAALMMIERGGTYYGRVNVVVVPPVASNPQEAANPLERPIQVTLDFAGILAKDVGSIGSTKVSVSSAVTLLDEGVRHGWSVRQPAVGNQWELVFSEPLIEVQATGTSVEEVRERIDTVVARIERAALARQDAADVSQTNRVSFLLSPPDPPVFYADGSPVRAGVAMGVVGCLAAWAGAAVVGALARRRTRTVWTETDDGPPAGRPVGREVVTT